MAQRCNQLAALHGAWCWTSDVWLENSSHFSVAWICVGAGKLVSPPLALVDFSWRNFHGPVDFDSGSFAAA